MNSGASLPPFTSPPLTNTGADAKLLRDPLQDTPSVRYAFDPAFKQTDEFLQVSTALEKFKNQRLQAVSDLKALDEERYKFVENPAVYLTAHRARVAADSEHKPFPAHQEISEVPRVNFQKFAALPNVVIDSEPEKPKSKPKREINTGKWTAQEQVKLERLLVEYPDEAVAQSRWDKIASELGTRTAKQIAARVSRRSKRMQKMGKDVPQRYRNSGDDKKSKNKKKRKRIVNPTNAPVPVEEELDEETYATTLNSDAIVQQKYTPEQRSSPAFVPILKWRASATKRRRNEIAIDKASYKPEPYHYGFSCTSCGKDPIIGDRWKCNQCPADTPVNLCKDCINKDYSTETHPNTHEFMQVETPEPPFFVDSDYQTLSEDFGYLRADFMPT